MKADDRARQELVLDVTRAISAHLRREDLFPAIGQALAPILPFDRMVVCVAGPVEREGVSEEEMLVYAQGENEERIPAGTTFPLDGSVPGQVLRSGEPFVGSTHEDLRPYPRSHGYMDELGVQSCCVVPLVTGSGPLGALAFHSRTESAFDDLDIELVQELANVIAIALDNCRAYEEIQELKQRLESHAAELERSREEQRQLLELNNAIVRFTDRDKLFESIASSLPTSLPYDRAALLLYRPDIDALELYALAGATAEKRPVALGFAYPRGTVWAWEAIERRGPLLVEDLEQREAASEEEASLVALGLRSLIAVPLFSADRLLGGLAVASLVPAEYDQGDADLLMKIGNQVALAVDKMLAFEEIESLKGRLELEKLYLQEEIKTEHNFEEIVGESPPLRRVLKDVETVAPTDATVLLTGETGTGKELIARAIHNLSPRRGRALMKVNCAALPEGLIESELFGHEKGAFTGALNRKIGRFQLADGGTILLDEVGDLPLELQGKLLRVLQEGQFERVGGTTTLRVDARVIAATNRDLEEAVAHDRFRADLYYRLNVFPIELPPLRERGDDIRLLVNYFVSKFSKRVGKEVSTIPREAMRRLLAYPWHGNVRELRNVIERAVILSRQSRLQLDDSFGRAARLKGSAPARLDDVQRHHIVDVLQQTGWRVSGSGGAAEILGLKPTTLESRMKKLGIRRPS